MKKPNISIEEGLLMLVTELMDEGPMLHLEDVMRSMYRYYYLGACPEENYIAWILTIMNTNCKNCKYFSYSLT